MSDQPRIFHPKNLDEAIDLLSRNPGARLLAGGTDFLVKWRNGMFPGLDGVIDLGRIPLDGIHQEKDHIVIGAGCTMSAISSSELIRERCPALAAAASQVGALQIRNAATLGGNVANASPAGDTIPALYSLEAVVLIRGQGKMRRVPIQEFFTGPGKTVLEKAEIIEAFEISDKPSRGTFLKLGERLAHAISKVSLALSVRVAKSGKASVRVALGAVAPTVIRATAAEEHLEGQPWPPSPETMEKAAELAVEAAKPIDDIRSVKGYRKKMAGTLLRHALESTVSKA